MASIHREFKIEASPEKAWEALRDVGGINRLITFLGEVKVEGDRRHCDLGDKGAMDELIVDVSEERRRVAYSIRESPFGFGHHHASMQVVANEGSGATFIWTTDVKPDEAAGPMSEVMDAAVKSFQETLR